MEPKVCRWCGVEKAAVEFSPERVNSDGLKSYCKVCQAEKQRLRRSKPGVIEREVEARRLRKAAGQRYPSETLKVRRTPEPGTPEWERRRQHGFRVRAARWHANRFGAQVNDLRLKDWLVVLVEHGHRCAYCGASDDLWIEHQVPICRGGDNTRANVVPACESCNREKARRTAEEFLENLCRNGHPQTPENVYVYPNGKKKACKPCRRLSGQQHRERKKE